MRAVHLVRKILTIIALVGLFSFGQTALSHAETQASFVVRSFYAQLTNAMKQGDQLGFSGRYRKLDPAVRAAFNLPLMAKVSVGSSWVNASPQEQKELVEAFSDFSVASYASQFVRDDGVKFSVTDEKPGEDGSVVVESVLQPQTGDPVALNYLMRLDNQGKFRIVDVYLNGTISELATRRAEFSSIARRDGIEALVNSLGQKSKELGPS